MSARKFRPFALALAFALSGCDSILSLGGAQPYPGDGSNDGPLLLADSGSRSVIDSGTDATVPSNDAGSDAGIGDTGGPETSTHDGGVDSGPSDGSNPDATGSTVGDGSVGAMDGGSDGAGSVDAGPPVCNFDDPTTSFDDCVFGL